MFPCMEKKDTFTLSELAETSGVSKRSIRYYIQSGLLPAAPRTGRGTVYPSSHLARLALIQQLKERHQPLDEIRRQIEDLSDAEVVASLGESERRAESRATSYIDAVLGASESCRSGEPGWSSSPSSPSSWPGARGSTAQSPARSGSLQRSRWDRVSLSRDVEIHLRRPLSSRHRKQVERLIEFAVSLFHEEQA